VSSFLLFSNGLGEAQTVATKRGNLSKSKRGSKIDVSLVAMRNRGREIELSFQNRAAAGAVLVAGVSFLLSGCAGAEMIKSGQLDARAACQSVVDATEAADPAQANSYLDMALRKADAAAAANGEYSDLNSSLNRMLMAIASNDQGDFSVALDSLAQSCDAVDPDPDWSDVVKRFLS